MTLPTNIPSSFKTSFSLVAGLALLLTLGPDGAIAINGGPRLLHLQRRELEDNCNGAVYCRFNGTEYTGGDGRIPSCEFGQTELRDCSAPCHGVEIVDCESVPFFS